MTGAILGAMLAVGLLSVWDAVQQPAPVRSLWRPRFQVSPVVVVTAAAFVVAAATVLLLTGVPAVAVVLGALAALLPATVVRSRAERRGRAVTDAWPDAIDHLGSAVRAGLSLVEALTQLGERGPEALRTPFTQFGRDVESTGRFDESLDRLKARLADPVGDRVVEALRLARHVGGGDLGSMLRSLSGFLREDQRTRGELESRQSWTVNGARLAVAAPWLVLGAMSFQPDVIARFGTPAGFVVLVGGACVCVVSYQLMVRLGRLPRERRMLT